MKETQSHDSLKYRFVSLINSRQLVDKEPGVFQIHIVKFSKTNSYTSINQYNQLNKELLYYYNFNKNFTNVEFLLKHRYSSVGKKNFPNKSMTIVNVENPR